MAKLQRAKLSKERLSSFRRSNSVTPLEYTHLVLHVKHYSNTEGVLKPIYVYRALYNSVPPVNSVGKTVMHKDRLPLVQNIYTWLVEISCLSGSTANYYFDSLSHFFRFCDANEYKAELINKTVSAYAQHIINLVRAKPESSEVFRGRANVFTVFLRWAGHDDLARLLPQVSRNRTHVGKTIAYTDDEQIGVTRDLFRVFNVLASRLKTGEPTTCPFDQPVAGWDVLNSNRTAWYNKLTATALFLTCNFVGDNSTPLRNLRRSDVAAREFYFDKTINLYRLVTTKGRQNGQKNEWDLGFTQRGRDFFRAYLCCLDLFDLPDDAYLFPYFIHGKYKGNINQDILKAYSHWFIARCQHGVRPIIGRFRQSKSSGLMADTNSVAIVAEGLNNLKTTVARHYLNGNPHNNRNRLGSAAEALELTARGATVEEARNVVEAKYGRPLRVMEIVTRGEHAPTQTKIGTRCMEPFGEKAQRLKWELVKGGLLGEDESVPCFKFLECFGCSFRALVAEVDDLWCMMSFRESLLEALQRPTINHHLPVDKVRDVIAQTQAILADVERDYPDVYAGAVDKFNHQAHPLWDDEDSLSDLFYIW